MATATSTNMELMQYLQAGWVLAVAGWLAGPLLGCWLAGGLAGWMTVFCGCWLPRPRPHPRCCRHLAYTATDPGMHTRRSSCQRSATSDATSLTARENRQKSG